MSKSEIQVLDFEKICRLCLLEKRSMSAIFSKKKSDKKVPLPVRIMSCASLQLYEGDGLPASICNKCLMSVNQSYAFREQCEQADTTLRQYAQRLTEANEEASTRNDGNDKNSVNILPKREREDCSDVDITLVYRDHQYIKLPSNWDSPTEDVTIKTEENVINDEMEVIKEEIVVEEEEKPSKSSNAIYEYFKNAQVTIKKIKKEVVNKKSVKKPMTYNLPFVLRNEKENLSKSEENKVVIKPAKSTKKSKNENFVYCDECDKFLKPNSILGHKRYVHGQVKLHLCPTCGYRANTGSILRQHVQAVHVGYTFPCDECPLKFNLLKRLKRHKQLKHSKEPVAIEKKHVCHYCGHRFEKKFHLNNHLLTHTNETPFDCEYCDRKFKYKWALNQHQRLHTGAKGYKCQYCDKTFVQINSNFKRIHELKVHGIGYENQKTEKD